MTQYSLHIIKKNWNQIPSRCLVAEKLFKFIISLTKLIQQYHNWDVKSMRFDWIRWTEHGCLRRVQNRRQQVSLWILDVSAVVERPHANVNLLNEKLIKPTSTRSTRLCTNMANEIEFNVWFY